MTRKTQKSTQAYQRACEVLVGGVNSPVRAYSAVGGEPPIISKAQGSRIIDIDDNEYIDYVASYGPLILGHAVDEVVTAINKAVTRGTSYGANSELEAALAEKIISALPNADKVRFTSSGTEATMTAIRIARGVTGRDKIVKFAGCYHGHSDALLVSAGSGATTLGVPSSPGVPKGATCDTIVLNYNDAEAVKELFAAQGDEIAAILVEPIAGNMGVIPPAEGFLETLRQCCDDSGAMLIMDEVMTGFRVAWGTAQNRYGVLGDITTLGKIIGGGMPVGAIAARKDIMDNLAPLGGIYQAGTLSGNPAAMAAGLATLELIEQDEDFYDKLEATSARLENELRSAADSAGMADEITINRVGSMMCLFFSTEPVENYAAATACDTGSFGVYMNEMLNSGVFLPPSQFEAFFVSSAHCEDDIIATASAAADALTKVKTLEH